MKNWMFKIVMVIVITSLVITVVSCRPAEPKLNNGDAPTDTSLNVTETEKPGSEPTCKWGTQQEVDTWTAGGYFLPENMAEEYAHNGINQGNFYYFIMSPLLERGVTEDPSGRFYLPISGGGFQVSPKNGDFYIHPDDQARLDQGEQLRKVRVLWFGHVPSLEKKYGRLVNANGEEPEKEWIAFSFLVHSNEIVYGELPQLIVSPTGRGSVKLGAKEGRLLSLELP